MSGSTRIEFWKLWVSIATVLVATIGLVVTYVSFLASVERERVDRTLSLIALADTPHIEHPRDAFQEFLINFGRTRIRLGSEEDMSTISALLLSAYRRPDGDGVIQDAWWMIRPLGDYYGRILACIDADACSEEIYCAMVARELVTFAEMTRTFRSNDTRLRVVFAARLDREMGVDRCG